MVKVKQLGDLARKRDEPTKVELDRIESDVKANAVPTQTRQQVIADQILTKQRRIADLTLAVRTEDDIDHLALMAEVTKLDGEVKRLTVQLELGRFDEIRQGLVDGILALVEPYGIKRLHFEIVESEADGVMTRKPVLMLDHEIFAGVRKKVAKCGEGKISNWRVLPSGVFYHNKVTGEDKHASDVYKDIGQGRWDGTADAGAWSRLLQYMQAQNVGLDWVANQSIS